MKRISIRSKEFNSQLSEYGYDYEVSKKDLIELVEDETRYVCINKQLSFFFYNDRLVPSLKLLQQKELLKKVVVDMGAIKFVVSGADIMRPGVVDFDDNINKDDFIMVIDVTNRKPLCVGISLFSSLQLKDIKTGKIIKNVHYVGDKLWTK